VVVQHLKQATASHLPSSGARAVMQWTMADFSGEPRIIGWLPGSPDKQALSETEVRPKRGNSFPCKQEHYWSDWSLTGEVEEEGICV
jgi:hypothetical protein